MPASVLCPTAKWMENWSMPLGIPVGSKSLIPSMSPKNCCKPLSTAMRMPLQKAWMPTTKGYGKVAQHDRQVILVGISYDKETKNHKCHIEH